MKVQKIQYNTTTNTTIRAIKPQNVSSFLGSHDLNGLGLRVEDTSWGGGVRAPGMAELALQRILFHAGDGGGVHDGCLVVCLGADDKILLELQHVIQRIPRSPTEGVAKPVLN